MRKESRRQRTKKHAKEHQGQLFSFFRACKARFQEKVQAHLPWNVLERSLSSYNPSGYAPDIFALFRRKYSPLHDLSLLRQYSFLIFFRRGKRRNELDRFKFGDLFEDKRAEISFRSVKERLLSYQFCSDIRNFLHLLSY